MQAGKCIGSQAVREALPRLQDCPLSFNFAARSAELSLRHVDIVLGACWRHRSRVRLGSGWGGWSHEPLASKWLNHHAEPTLLAGNKESNRRVDWHSCSAELAVGFVASDPKLDAMLASPDGQLLSKLVGNPGFLLGGQAELTSRFAQPLGSAAGIGSPSSRTVPSMATTRIRATPQLPL